RGSPEPAVELLKQKPEHEHIFFRIGQMRHDLAVLSSSGPGQPAAIVVEEQTHAVLDGTKAEIPQGGPALGRQQSLLVLPPFKPWEWRQGWRTALKILKHQVALTVRDRKAGPSVV